jgi:hypothetical protein
MQMRSCAVWLSVVGLVTMASVSSAWAAPKHKKAKAAADSDSSEVATPAAEKPKDVDSMMDDSSKPKASTSTSHSDDTAAAPESADVGSGEPDAWEKPPAEEEKPKAKAVETVEVKKGDGHNLEVGLLAGWGFTSTRAPFSADPYQFGAGLRVGYTFDFHLVVALGFEYFLGSSNTSSEMTGGVMSAMTTTKANYIWFHGEVGYDIWFGKLLLRPSLWLAIAPGTQSPPVASGTSGVITATLVQPGLSLMYMLGDHGWYLGVDAHFSLVIGTGTSTLPLFAQLGKRFSI